MPLGQLLRGLGEIQKSLSTKPGTALLFPPVEGGRVVGVTHTWTECALSSRQSMGCFLLPVHSGEPDVPLVQILILSVPNF